MGKSGNLSEADLPRRDYPTANMGLREIVAAKPRESRPPVSVYEQIRALENGKKTNFKENCAVVVTAVSITTVDLYVRQKMKLRRVRNI